MPRSTKPSAADATGWSSPPDEMSRRVHLKCARDATGDALITREATDEVPPGDRLLGELQLLTAMRLCSCGGADPPGALPPTEVATPATTGREGVNCLRTAERQ